MVQNVLTLFKEFFLLFGQIVCSPWPTPGKRPADAKALLRNQCKIFDILFAV